ncbi:MAG TPA: chorismate-binding protein [Acidimicrobiia bacterium]|nr:chorismate-binding protein [Acidimicrobiia bacterium]
MNPVWVDSENALAGVGEMEVADPGSGMGRYGMALDLVRRSGRKVGFASFTFDVDETGSVVEIPDDVGTFVPTSGDLPGRLELIDDGIEEWRVGFAKAMLEIESGRVGKVVLARQVSLGTDTSPDERVVVSRLVASNPGCHVFSIGGLLGASPELLVRLRNGRISSLALAGTATDPDELATVKISEEHRHVSNSVTEALSKHMSAVDLTEQVIVPHGAMSHVGTRIEGPAHTGTTIADVLADLHPTAAVAGSPTPAAIDLIREIEPLSRRRYAGPVGWIDARGDGVFAIALRCGTIEEGHVTLYSGGGLVAGSEEHAELYETELKLVPMLEALGQT